jgi:hypothetical protein
VTVDFDRLVDRWAIAHEMLTLVEQRSAEALLAAEWLLRPTLKLVDEQQRIVRVVRAPREVRAYPPPALVHGYWDMLRCERRVEVVGSNRSSGGGGRDIDYTLVRTAGGDELLALLRDEIEPSVVVRRFVGGGTDLLTSFDA